MKKHLMIKPRLTLFTAALLALASCGKKAAEHSQTAPGDSTAAPTATAPVETKEPNTTYQPAFPG